MRAGLALLTALALSAPAAAADWPTFNGNAQRTGYLASTGITAANVGRLVHQQVQLPGVLDSTPIYVGGSFYATTIYGKTVRVDAKTGRIRWTFTPPGYASYAGSAQITNAPPTADPSGKFIYAAAPDGRVRKLATSNGHAVWAAAVTKLPTREKLAAGLNFDNGHVIVATDGYIGDAPPYQGHVVLLNAANGKVVSVWNSLCSNRHALLVPSSCPSSDSAIWARSGVVVEKSHRLLFATGNAPWDGQTNWADSVVELTPNAGLLTRHWTPTDVQALGDADLDLGSTGPALLDADWFVQGGKDGKLRLLRISKLPGSNGQTGGEVQTVPTPGSTDLFSQPFTWQGRWAFLATGNGTDAWRFTGSRLVKAWGNGSSGTSPLVAGGLLYVEGLSGGLRVYRPTTGRLVATLPTGDAHWQSPVVADGVVAVGEGNANSHGTSGVLNLFRAK